MVVSLRLATVKRLRTVSHTCDNRPLRTKVLVREPKGEGTQRPGIWVPWHLGSPAFGFSRLWAPSPLKPGNPKAREPKGQGTQRRRNPKVKEPKGEGTQRPGILGSLAFGFPRLWVPSPLGSFTFEAGNPKAREPKGRGTQRRRNPKARDFGFLRLKVPWPLGSPAFGFPRLWFLQLHPQNPYEDIPVLLQSSFKGLNPEFPPTTVTFSPLQQFMRTKQKAH